MATRILLLGVVALGLVSAASADVVQFRFGQNLTGTGTPYTGTQDTWIGGTRGPSNNPTDANGFVRTGPGDPIDVAIRFDNILGSATGLVPQANPNPSPGPFISSVTINSATLSFTGGNGQTVNLTRILVPWTDTGIGNFSGNAHAGPDGTEISGILSSSTTGTFDVTSSLQGYVNGTLTNLGWALGTTGGDTVLQLLENGTLGNRPLLTVDFTANFDIAMTPEPGSIILWSCIGLGGLGACYYRRKKRQNPTG